MDGDPVAFTNAEAWVNRSNGERSTWLEFNSAEAALKGVRTTDAVITARFGNLSPLPAGAFLTDDRASARNKKLN